ncbi:MAG TPA: alpha/beta fold hydrolase [Ktedonobacterales bacterium]|nr:alpha/beta fold hydrolase [Ktedonobacterales bacterium]
MAAAITYQPAYNGEWGTPRVVAGGTYGTDTLKLPDGTTIFYRFWQHPNPQAPVLVLVHGLGAHSAWFLDFASALHVGGQTVYALDHRGFGRSGGPRGHIQRGDQFLEDVEALLDIIGPRHPDVPRVLLGHSMGGLFSIHLAARDATSGKGRIAGVILVNPWIRDSAKVSPRALLSVILGGPRGSMTIPAGTDAADTSVMTLNPEAARMLLEDERWVRRRTASFYYQIALGMRGKALRQARLVRAPALVIQVERDRSVIARASEQCFKALGSAEKQWLSIPEMAHDFEFEPARGPLDDAIVQWMGRFRR